MAVLLLFALPAPDEVVLDNGTVLHGTVTERGDFVDIAMERSAISIPRDRVRLIRSDAQLRAEYLALRGAADPDSADSAVSLASWCRDHGFAPEEREHWNRVLELNPEHVEAREALGYRRWQGRWLTEDEFYQALGYVQVDGAWMSAEQRDYREAAGRLERIRRETRLEILRHVTRGVASPEEAAEARASLNVLAREDLVPVYLDLLDRERDATRIFVIGELARLCESTAVPLLVEIAVRSRSRDERRAAIDAVLAIASADTALEVRPYLTDEGTDLYRRRAVALAGDLRDRRLMPALVGLLEPRLATLQWVEQRTQEIVERVSNSVVVLSDGTVVALPRNVNVVWATLDQREMDGLRDEADGIIEALQRIVNHSHYDDVEAWARCARGEGE